MPKAAATNCRSESAADGRIRQLVAEDADGADHTDQAEEEQGPRLRFDEAISSALHSFILPRNAGVFPYGKSGPIPPAMRARPRRLFAASSARGSVPSFPES